MKTLPTLGLLFSAGVLLAACQPEPGPDLTASQRKLNDTGITWGGNYPKDINQDCSAVINAEKLPEGDLAQGDILAQQDCTRGRDTLYGAGNGFSYSKISSTGKTLSESAKEWHCVRDNVSGLMWEAKVSADDQNGNGGLHDADDRFTWYSGQVAANGGAVGEWNQKYDQCAGYNKSSPATYCNTGEFVERVNAAGLCGYTDWRLPSLQELQSLVNFGVSRPAVDGEFFPHTQNDFYWSSSPVVGKPTSAWAVSFQFGYSAPLQRNNSRFVRLVRDAPSSP
ncbi:DUF1566 domain-containing protein [Teredinibacter turnerae]|uniref:Lcl C-terminal domain-containing protein n=1 Tax=Teredinibacter turnerae TaxID=2426 RepID=UPI00037EB57F|nr:DUF1566 domain-containing protein [Teredinibacter turnerae]